VVFVTVLILFEKKAVVAVSTKPALSIVVPTYKREDRLCEALRALLELRDENYEILIVDQTPKHHQKTEAYLSNLPDHVRVLRVHVPNLPAARNLGARDAKADIVLYLDDDIKPLPSLLAAHLRHYQDATVGAVAGRLLSPYAEIKKLDPRYYTSPMPWRYIRFDQQWPIREVETAPGGNMSCRRHLICQIGGFDEQFVGNAFREETDFCLRLRNASYRIVFDPEAALIHYWKTEGGCDHIRFGNPDFTSYGYYQDFVQNNVYFCLKHAPRASMPELIWELYRNHIGNRYNLRRGVKHLFYRHAAFCIGAARGYAAWRHHVLMAQSGQIYSKKTAFG
jgi:GT2 family glycosyltransferase